jgi:hypothetical protein
LKSHAINGPRSYLKYVVLVSDKECVNVEGDAYLLQVGSTTVDVSEVIPSLVVEVHVVDVA